MITVLFFAQLREALGCEQLELEAGNVFTVAQLQSQLQARGENWQKALGDERVLVAVNQSMAKPDTPVGDGDEVALFPPVTGG